MSTEGAKPGDSWSQTEPEALEEWKKLAVRIDLALTRADSVNLRSVFVAALSNRVFDTACHLARAMTANGWTTCLIDGGDDALATVIISPKHETIVERPAVHRERDSPMLPRTDRVRALYTELSDECQWVVLAGPPLTSADGLAIAGVVDGILLTVGSRGIDRSEARQVRTSLNAIDAKLIGIVLTDG